jgi:2'-5' RNA ligase
VSAEAAPLIVSALLAPADFAWADSLRRAHFPPERNLLPAHLTLFHHLPPSLGPELKQRLAEAAQGGAPGARTRGLLSLGRGVAIRIDSPGLEQMRADLADAFAGMLTPQDQAGWRPHITIQNKVAPAEAKSLLTLLEKGWRDRPLGIAGLAAWHYRGGPWELLSRHMFRG